MNKNYLLFHRKQKLKNSQVSAQAKNMRKIIKLLKIRRYKFNRMSKRKYFCDIWSNCVQKQNYSQKPSKNFKQIIKIPNAHNNLKPIMLRRHPP